MNPGEPAAEGQGEAWTCAGLRRHACDHTPGPAPPPDSSRRRPLLRGARSSGHTLVPKAPAVQLAGSCRRSPLGCGSLRCLAAAAAAGQRHLRQDQALTLLGQLGQHLQAAERDAPGSELSPLCLHTAQRTFPRGSRMQSSPLLQPRTAQCSTAHLAIGIQDAAAPDECGVKGPGARQARQQRHELAAPRAAVVAANVEGAQGAAVRAGAGGRQRLEPLRSQGRGHVAVR